MARMMINRKAGEDIVVEVGGVTIAITIERINRNRVQVSLIAPKEASIDRGEVWRRKQEEPQEVEPPDAVGLVLEGE